MDEVKQSQRKLPQEEEKVGSLLPTLSNNWVDRLLKYYLIPDATFLSIWTAFMVGVSIANAIILTFMAAFRQHDPASWFFSYLIDIIYIIDIYQKFHIAFLQNGFWVVFPNEMMMNYIHSTEFRVDIIANLPTDFIALCFLSEGEEPVQFYLALVRLSKVIRSYNIFGYFRKHEKRLHASFTLQIVKFITYVVVLNHTVACVWFAIACPNGVGSCNQGSWANKVVDLHNTPVLACFYNNIDQKSVSGMYLNAMYWTVTTMTTTGYGDIHPENPVEKIFALFSMIMGIFFYGYVSGTIASTLANMDSSRVAYRQKFDAVRLYMNDRKMEKTMQHRVLNYYDYVWERNKGMVVKNMFDDMPSTFHREVALNLNNQIIDHAPIFKNCSIGFRRNIAIHMRLHLITANEYAVYHGDLGTELYFITQGRIDIYSQNDSKRPTASLIEGTLFGEFAVILGHRHEYSARAVCNTDIFVLTKEHLEEAFQAYPADKLNVVRLTEEKYRAHLSTKKSRKVNLGEDSDDYYGGGVSVMEKETPTLSEPLAINPGVDNNLMRPKTIDNRRRSSASGFLILDAKQQAAFSSMPAQHERDERLISIASNSNNSLSRNSLSSGAKDPHSKHSTTGGVGRTGSLKHPPPQIILGSGLDLEKQNEEDEYAE